uniref:Uncharacterized protein n=1 Tax=Anguilla anguilla TaxID=7936 RepID=A0A0E9TBQ5_ANGAN
MYCSVIALLLQGCRTQAYAFTTKRVELVAVRLILSSRSHC